MLQPRRDLWLWRWRVVFILCAAPATPAALTTAEHIDKADINWRLYWAYFRAGGSVATLVCVAVFIFGGAGLTLASSWWLAAWARLRPSRQNDMGVWLPYIGFAVAVVRYRFLAHSHRRRCRLRRHHHHRHHRHHHHHHHRTPFLVTQWSSDDGPVRSPCKVVVYMA